MYEVKARRHVLVQAIPAGRLTTRPRPPLTATVSRKVAGAKNAETDLLLSSVTVQSFGPEQSPDQRTKRRPFPGSALRLISEPASQSWPQVAVHWTPVGSLVISPAPVIPTVRCTCSCTCFRNGESWTSNHGLEWPYQSSRPGSRIALAVSR